MPLDPQIPLAVAQQPSFAQQMGQTFEMAGAIEKQQQFQQQRQDQQLFQSALKNGADFKTPTGILAAAEQLKGKVSPSAYQTMITAADDMKTNESKRIEAMARIPPELIKAAEAQNSFMGQTLQQLMSTYDEDAKQFGTQEANNRLKQHKKDAIQRITSQQTGGQSLVPPAFIKDLDGMNRAQMNAAFEGTVYGQEQLDRVSKRRLQEAQRIEALKKGEAAAKGGAGAAPEEITKSPLHGQEFLALLSPGEAADTLAVAEGRKSLSDIPARGGARQRIGQYVTQFDPGFSSVRNAADRAASMAISKDIAAIRPFTEMLDKNAEIAIDLSKKAIATNSRLANRSVNWLRQNMGDNPDVAEFLAQTTFVQTEAARVLNNPRLVGQLTDTARQEMEHVISGDMPLKSYERVIRRIQQDSKNRVQAMEDQRNRILAGGAPPKEIPQSELKKTGASAMPKGLPEGSKQVGRTPDGKAVWQAPNGKNYVE